MPRYEYKVVPAPTKGLKAKGVKGAEARFSNAIQTLMNDLAGDGWEYQRAETLPSVERSGLTSTTTEWRNVLVFRRPPMDDADAFAPELLPAPAAADPRPAGEASEPEVELPVQSATEVTATPADEPEAEVATAVTAPAEPWDNGVEGAEDVGGMPSSLETLAAARNSAKTDD